MVGAGVVIDFSVSRGLGEVQLDDGVVLSFHATAIAGALNDNTHHGPSPAEGRPCLVITGLILFGGTEVKS